MKAKHNAENQKTMKEPFYKRIPSNIAYWFQKKGQNIKHNFMTYIKSKETWKMWRRRLIVVGVIILILISFEVKNYMKLYPYDEASYLITDKDRTNLTNYNGVNGISRVVAFKENVEAKTDDAIKITYSIMSYDVTEELRYKADSDTIELTIDNRKNKMISKDERAKTTIVYSSEIKEETSSDAKRKYYLIAEGKPKYLIAQVDLSKLYEQQAG